MQISIQNLSQVPIYEQIVEQFKSAILNRELQPGSILPSVRVLAKELDISALTVKKAYDLLEKEGFLNVVHGKGSFVAETNKELMQEEFQKKVESLLEEAIDTGLKNGVSKEEIQNIFDMILEERRCILSPDL